MAKTAKTVAKAETKTAAAEKTVQMQRKDAVSLLEALGFMQAKMSSNEVLSLRMTKVENYLEGFEGTLTGDQTANKDRVLLALKSGAKVQVVGEEPKGVKKVAVDPQTKKVVKKTAAKKAEPRKTKKRVECLCEALRKLPKGGKTPEDVAKVANEEYVKAGGDDNLNQTVHHLHVILPAAICFGVVTVADGMIRPGE